MDYVSPQLNGIFRSLYLLLEIHKARGNLRRAKPLVYFSFDSATGPPTSLWPLL